MRLGADHFAGLPLRLLRRNAGELERLAQVVVGVAGGAARAGVEVDGECERRGQDHGRERGGVHEATVTAARQLRSVLPRLGSSAAISSTRDSGASYTGAPGTGQCTTTSVKPRSPARPVASSK